MKMRRISQIGLTVILGFVLILPAFAQSGENAEWQAIEDQRDARRKAELLDAFIKKNTGSPHRPDADFMLIDFYTQNKDYQKILQLASDYQQRPPFSDATAKGRIFFSAMVAAASLNNVDKTKEFGKYALEADPNNFTVLAFLAGSNLPDPARAMEYAQKAVSLSRPATMSEDQFAKMQGRMHAMVAVPLFAQQKFTDAREHLAIALKVNPKDQAAQFQFGFANVNLMGVAAKAAQEANDVLIKAMVATPTKQDEVDAAKAKVDAASKEALELRDAAIDSLAKALAIGGPFDGQAKQLFDSLYTNKNKSLDGRDQFIAQKKVELGL